MNYYQHPIAYLPMAINENLVAVWVFPDEQKISNSILLTDVLNTEIVVCALLVVPHIAYIVFVKLTGSVIETLGVLYAEAAQEPVTLPHCYLPIAI